MSTVARRTSHNIQTTISGERPEALPTRFHFYLLDLRCGLSRIKLHRRDVRRLAVERSGFLREDPLKLAIVDLHHDHAVREDPLPGALANPSVSIERKRLHLGEKIGTSNGVRALLGNDLVNSLLEGHR